MTLSSLLEPPEPISADTHARTADPTRHLRTQFLRRVAHDIASPAGVIHMVLEQMETAERPRPDLVAMARRSLRKLTRISENLALVAVLEAGALQPEREEIDLRALTQRAFDDALAVDPRREVVAVCRLPAAPVVVAGDPRLLLVIMREVISNALKLATARVLVTLSAADGLASLRVEDDGPGFSQDSASSLGARFVERSTSHGLGLSLSMAVEIVRAHGGTLFVEASTLPPGRHSVAGAGVILTLPSSETPS